MDKKINRGVIRTGETDIKVHLIDSFPNHPYYVFDDEDTLIVIRLIMMTMTMPAQD